MLLPHPVAGAPDDNARCTQQVRHDEPGVLSVGVNYVDDSNWQWARLAAALTAAAAVHSPSSDTSREATSLLRALKQ